MMMLRGGAVHRRGGGRPRKKTARYYLPIAFLAMASTADATAPAELTAADVRELLAMSGFNPGTSRKLGGTFGIQTLTKVEVRKGNTPGEFVVTIRVVRTGD